MSKSTVPSVSFSQVVDAVWSAKTPGKKAAATRLRQSYLSSHRSPKAADAAIKAALTTKRNKNA